MERQLPGLDAAIAEFGHEMVERVLAGIRWVEQNKPDTGEEWLWRAWSYCFGFGQMPSFDMRDPDHHLLCRVMDVEMDKADAIPERARERWYQSIRYPGRAWPHFDQIAFAYGLGAEQQRLLAFRGPIGQEDEPDLMNLLWPQVLRPYMFTKTQWF